MSINFSHFQCATKCATNRAIGASVLLSVTLAFTGAAFAAPKPLQANTGDVGRSNTSSGKVSQQEIAMFIKADKTMTGRLTKKQAFQAGMYEVDRYFFDMDTDIDGYVTMDELKAWKAKPVRTSPRPRGDKLDRFVAGDANRR